MSFLKNLFSDASIKNEKEDNLYMAIFGYTVFAAFGLILYSITTYNAELAALNRDSSAALARISGMSEKAKVVSENLPVTPVAEPQETNRIIVKFKEGNLPPGLSVAAERANLEKAQGLTKVLTISGINADVYEVSDDDTASEVVDRIMTSKKDVVEYAEVDLLIPPMLLPNDPYYSSQWHHPKVETPTAWDGVLGDGVTVAILDTGVNQHPDLVWSPIQAKNFYSGTNDVTDVFGHGSKVAGTAVATGNNAIGVSGIAPNSPVLPIKIARDSDGYGSLSAISQGITYAADNGVRIASISYMVCDTGFSAASAARYMRSKGGVVIASGGNTGMLNTTASTPEITCVSATDSNDGRPSWSTWSDYIDVAAPGVGIYTTNNAGGYTAPSGTSFSAPLTAGIYALMFSANPSLTPAQADNILFSTADDLGTPGWDQYYGYGRVNVAKAVAAAQAAVGTRDTVAPSVPQNLRTTSVTSNSISLAWNASTDDNSGVAGYDLYRNGTKIATVSGTTYTNSGLTSNTPYTYTVRATDSAGNVSAPSNEIAATTADISFGISGSSVTTKTTTSATIGVTLTKPGTVTVKYGKSTTALTSSAQSSTSGTSHSVSLTGLTAKTTYYYQVVATDATGQTVTGPISSFKTAAGGGKR